ncbi:hypothetical protein BGX29_000060 [Mortierella sp. GBA35]|nr:hypothetical protein BGX23_007457 [Mortierella sp. AD031]KAF9108423.1 hypothetical protein BGX29_000060 [Mortierella sp. GBA35]KAG0219805.1 hypothetical protein BGX33_000647 [Mortierella sp. NVP41]
MLSPRPPKLPSELDLALEDGAKTPPRKSRARTAQIVEESVGTPLGYRRSDRLRKKMADYVSSGETITTPRGSSIHGLFPKELEKLIPPSPRRVELDNFKRRLQFKSGARSNLMKTEAYKSLERKEKLKAFQEDQRGKRNNAQFKSRGLSLPAISKTRKTSVTLPSKEGEKPKVQFVPRHNLRPRVSRQQPVNMDALSLHGSGAEKRKGQYKQLKTHDTVDFVSWSERDDAWRTKRLANYQNSSKLARETSLFKKRKLSICGWGNPQKNLGNYLSICWEYNPDLDADKDQRLQHRYPAILNKNNDKNVCVESGVIYYPDVLTNDDNIYLTGFCFTIQSELALRYDTAQKELFDQASDLVHRSFYQYQMDLSLDSSLDDNFTVDIFVSSMPSTDYAKITVRGVTQFIFMKGYIYVDKICVEKEHQKSGIGAMMMGRIEALAKLRNKDILLYALGPVVKVYQKWGFKYCKEWPAIEKDIGVIMRKRIATKDVVDDFVGLQWDGTGFS